MLVREVHYGDVGTAIMVAVTDNDAALDVTGGTATFLGQKPSGRRASLAMALASSTGGVVSYTTTDGMLDEIGDWYFQVKIELGGGDWVTEEAILRVLRRLEA